MALVVLAAGLLAGCEQVALTPSPAPTPEGCRIPVGVVTSLSGEYQGRAAELVHGYELARDDINAAGGILGCRLDLIVRDDASTLEQAQRAMTALIEEDRVLIVLGTFASIITVDLVRQAADARVPLLAHNSTNFLITDQRFEWVFRTIQSSWESYSAMTRFVSTLPLDTLPSVALLHEDSAYGQDAYVTLHAQLKNYGIPLADALPLPEGDADRSATVARLEASGATLLFMAGNSVPDAIAMLEAIAEADLRFDAYLTLGGAYTSGEFLQSPYSEYFLASVPWVSTFPYTDALSGWTIPAFTTHFSDRFGRPPGYRSVNAYVNVYLAKAALEAALSPPWDAATAPLEQDRRAVRDALRTLDVPETLFGPIRFDRDGQNTTGILITQIRGGEFVVISPDDRAEGALVLPAPAWSQRAERMQTP
jgi:branched-chain amino acid transport system substrate-binding protein